MRSKQSTNKSLFLFLLVFCLVATPIAYGALGLTPSSGAVVDRTDGVVAHATLGATDLNYATTDDMNCTFSGSLIGTTTVVNNDTASPDQELNTSITPSTLPYSCNYALRVDCVNATLNLNTTSTSICVQEFETEDLDNVFMDFIGGMGVAFVGLIALLVFAFVFVWVIMRLSKAGVKFKFR